LDSRFAGVVAGNAILFVGGVVFLVDDEDAQIFEWREYRRPRSDDNGHFFFPDFFPFQETLDVGEPAVQNCDF